MSRPNRSKTYRAAATLFFAALLAGSACSEPHEQTITGETHFLKLCTSDAACNGRYSCLCGVCTQSCDANAACAALPGAECVTAEDAANAQSCQDAPPANHCDVSCGSDADCRGLSQAHRCSRGFCRAEVSGAAGAGAGTGGRGGGGQGAVGGDDAGAAGDGGCSHGVVSGNQVVVLGDTFMSLTHEITASLEDLARASGALPAGQRYRDESTVLANGLALGGNGILNQYERAAGEASVSVVIMNGGGADALNGVCDEPVQSSCPALSAAAAAASDLFARMAADGVEHVVYAFYPNPTDAVIREKIDVLRPLVQAACSASPVPCDFVDLRPTFEGHYAEYITAGGVNPTTAGSTAAANAIWAAMQASCIAQ